MTITQMQYFVSVCEYGTITKAAEVLHVSQPSISLAIKDLEEQLGVTLFDRENKRFQLSQEGKYMYGSTKDILTQINALEVQMRDLGKHRKRLCVALPILTGMFMLNLFMDGFRDSYSGVRFVIKQCNSAKAFKALDEGSCDVAIIVDEEQIPVNMEKRPIYRSEFVFCVHPDDPLAQKEAIDLIDLKNDPIILSQENSYMSKKLKTEFYNANAVPNILMYGVQLSLIRDLVSSGQAGTFLIKELADTWPEVVKVPLKETVPITFSLVWRKDKFLNRTTRSLIDHVLSKSARDADGPREE